MADESRLLDMLIAARKAASFLRGSTLAEFQDDELRQNAVTYVIQTIGEAASGVSDELRAAHPEIPWLDIIGMRHRLVHDYLNVDPVKVWETVVDDLPPLVTALERIVPAP